MDGNSSQNPAADQANQTGRPSQPGERPVYTPAPGVAPLPDQPTGQPVRPPVASPPPLPPVAPSQPPATSSGPSNDRTPTPPPPPGKRQLTRYKIALAVLGLICLALVAVVILQANTIKKNNEAHKTSGGNSSQHVPPAPKQ